MALGRATKGGPIKAFGDCMQMRTGKRKAGEAIGFIPVLGSLALAMGYTVVVGWIFKYTYLAFSGKLSAMGNDMSAIGGMFGSKGQQPIQIKQADQASYSAPKTGLERPEWITNGIVQQPVMPQSVYRDRLNVYRCGGHKR